MSAVSEILTVPWLLPGVVASLVVGLIFGRRLGSFLGTGPVEGGGLAFSVGVVLAATLTPGADALIHGIRGSGICDLSRFALASSNQLARAGEVALNVLLFIPLGVAVGILPRRRSTWLIAIAALALPVAIELGQLVVVRLGRECQSGDVIDNLTGLALGFLATTGVRGVRSGRVNRPASPGVRSGVAALVAAGILLTMLLVPTPTAGPTAVPSATAGPITPPATSGSSVRVSSVSGLLTALADDAVGEIVVADGTYHVSTAASQAPDSLWIGARYAGRTRPVTVRAETTGGVTFSGGGATAFGGLSFEAGAHDQTWDGFVFADGQPTQTGVITFGGYPGLAAPHHISLRNISLPRSLSSASGGATDGGLYFSQAVGGPHDISVDGLTVDGAGGLDFAVQFYHSTEGNPNAWNVSLRHLRVSGTQQAIILWDPTLHDITIEDSTISDAELSAVRYEKGGSLTVRRTSSTGSGVAGFYSTLGSTPPEVTFIDSALH